MNDKQIDKRSLSTILREEDARLATEWEADRDYAAAIQEAEEGDPTRLINRLRAKRPLPVANYEALARYIERGKRQSGPGAPGNAPMRECARLADLLLTDEDSPIRPPMSRQKVIEYARQAYEKWSGHVIDGAQLKALMNRPKSRRQKSTISAASKS
jgi:hypothetical protein